MEEAKGGKRTIRDERNTETSRDDIRRGWSIEERKRLLIARREEAHSNQLLSRKDYKGARPNPNSALVEPIPRRSYCIYADSHIILIS